MVNLFIGSKDDNFDASDSWHGYNYQGKVAIFVALKILNELYKQSWISEIENHYLEIEWLEDFSVLYRHNTTLKYVSIHQVKARADHNVKDYSDALESLAKKLYKNSDIKNAYIHTEANVNFTSEKWIEDIRNTIHSCNSAKETHIRTEEYIADVVQQESLLQQLNPSKRGRKSKYAEALLSFWREKNKQLTLITDKRTLSLVLEEFNVELSDSIQAFKTEINDSILRKISLYKYKINGDNISYCPAKAINRMIENEIYDYYYHSNVLPEVKGDRDFSERAFKYLLGFLDQHILERHVECLANKERKICLTKIDELLKDKVMIQRSVDFYIYHLRDNFFSMVTDNCKDCKASNQYYDCYNCLLPPAVEKIKKYTNEEFEKFLWLTFPHIESNLKNESGYKNIIRNENAYRTPFFELLEKGKYELIESKIPISFIVCSEGTKQIHLLSAMKSDRRPGTDIEHFCHKIITNTNLVGLLYEYNALTSKGLQKTTLSRGAGKVWETIQAENLEGFENHIYHLKDIQILPVEDY